MRWWCARKNWCVYCLRKGIDTEIENEESGPKERNYYFEIQTALKRGSLLIDVF